MTDVDPPAIITQKEKTKIMLEPFSKGHQQQLVGAYSPVTSLPPTPLGSCPGKLIAPVPEGQRPVQRG